MGTAELGAALLTNDRHRIVDAVAAASEPVHVDELASRVARIAAANAKLRPTKHDDEAQLRVRLHHVDVPALAARDVLEYQPGSKLVRRGPNFEEARAAYRRLARFAEERAT